jgi:hypothetical protein
MHAAFLLFAAVAALASVDKVSFSPPSLFLS